MSERVINWSLLQRLSEREHPLLNISDNLHAVPEEWLGEVFQEARNCHHLLDMIGIPRGEGYQSDLDARMLQVVVEVGDLRERLGRLSDWHSLETGPAGMENGEGGVT